MSFFERLRNSMARFMYGRNGVDQLNIAVIVVAIAMNIACGFIKANLAYTIVSTISTLLSLWVIFRLFSKNLYKRRAENDWFCKHIWWPLRGKSNGMKTQIKDREHKFFTCTCGCTLRVPKGKGKIIITCPKCGSEIHGKS